MSKYLLLLLILVLGTLRPAGAAEMAPAPAKITTIAGDSMNLTVVDYVNDHYVVVQVDPPVHNWFAASFVNLPTYQICTLGLSMEGTDTKGNQGSVAKWAGTPGLIPVMTYADPTQYASYEWYQKDEKGRWVSGDLFKTGNARYAGTGTVPEQTAIPKEAAEQFLFADGKYWQPWREVESAEAVAGLNIFRMKQKFAYPTATLAMRVPFTYSYLQLWLEKLTAAKLPGVYIDACGKTPQGRVLQIVRVEDPNLPTPGESHRTMVIIAREHANECASSWVALGALQALLAATPEARALRTDTTWLVVLIQDPDGSAASAYDRMTDKFGDDTYAKDIPEVPAYARYFSSYLYERQRTIDAVICLHGVECTEGPNIFCPIADPRALDAIVQFNQGYFAQVRRQGYIPGAPAPCWGKGLLSPRLYAWIAGNYGTFNLFYEVNDRYPTNRLSLAQLTHLGHLLAGSLSQWGSSPAGTTWHGYTRARLAACTQERTQYFAKKKRLPDTRTDFEVLVRGF